MAGMLTPAQRIIFAMIERAVEHGEPCPGNRAFAEAIGISSISGPPRVLDRLEVAGLIRVERGANSRVITITATGGRTAGSIKHRHWSERGVVKSTPQREFDQACLGKAAKGSGATRVSRDPCPRCATRADIGCRHSGAGQPQIQGAM